MKTVILSTLEYAPDVGGVAEYLSRIVERFPPGTVHVLAPKGGDTHESDMRSDAPIFRRRMSWKRLRPRWLPALYWTSWLANREKASLLVVSHLLPMGTVARYLRRRKGIPYVVIVHGMDVALALEAGGRKREEAKRVLSGAALVAANSAYTARLVEGCGVSAERIMIVRPSPSFPLYVSIPASAVEGMKKKYDITGGFALLSVGRLVKRKAFSTCIAAVAALKRKGIDMTYLIAGTGPERQALERQAREEDVEDRVRFLGIVPKAELPALYAACAAFAMVPRSIGPDVEGFGIVYLEANLMGLPVIGSRAGGVPDAVIHEETGLLVDPGDVEALAAAIARLKDDPALRERLGSQGRKRVLAEFNPKRQIDAFIGRILTLS